MNMLAYMLVYSEVPLVTLVSKQLLEVQIRFLPQESKSVDREVRVHSNQGTGPANH